MSDVREQLLGVVVGNLRERQGGDSQSLTNAILERFEGFETVEDYCRADCENSDLSDDQKRLCVQGCLLTEAEHFPAMTTEPRPVVPGQMLRERIARRIEPYYWHEGLDALVSEAPDSKPATERQLALIKADAILAEIAAAGLSIVASDRLERLRLAACAASNADIALFEPLQPGDLEPLAGGDR